jgi:asparagine synthase (glutamine-hydrolysing)
MCGISGSVDLESSYFFKILEHQTKRGNDSTNIMIGKPNVLLGHNRLSIIDISPSGNQPMSTERYQLTYNGEIYNYQSLRSKISPRQWKSYNDAETLLFYIDEKGIDQTLKDISGMFAFGVYDSHKKELHCVVDRMGEKPLYYYHDGKQFAFASSPAALTNLKDKWKLNRKALKSYWYLGSTFGEDTLFDGIKKLMPGHRLTFHVERSAITIERYWTPKFQSNVTDIEGLILDSIQQVKVSDVPVNIFLSGGVDSTLVASQCQGFGAVHMDSPEYPYAKTASERFGLKLLKVESNNVDSIVCLQDYAKECGEPSMAALIPYITAQQACKYGKVAITANGADELFYGYNRTIDTLENQMRHIFRPGYERLWAETYSKWFAIHDELNITGARRWFELMSFVAFDLNNTLDFASMCHTLEVRSPFLNHILVENALSLPKKRHFSGRFGAKTILKQMLSKMGFTDQYLNRPKLGFSLHNPPADLAEQKSQAYQWAKCEGYVNLDESQFTPRDWNYTLASAIGFKTWFDVWNEKISQ